MVLMHNHPLDYIDTFNEIINTLSVSDSKHSFVYLSEIYLQRGILEYQQNNKLAAIRAFSKAHSYWQKSENNYPDIEENLKMKGIFNLLIAHLPLPYKNWVNWVGFNGDTNVGLQTLEKYHQNQILTSGTGMEATLYLAFGYLKFGDNFDQIKSFVKQNTQSYSPEFLQSIIIRCAFKIQNPNLCSYWLNEEATANFGPLQYLKGKYATQMNNAKTISILNHFLKMDDINFKADAYRYLSWYFLLHNDTANYLKYQDEIKKLKGFPTSEDRQSLYETQINKIPNIILIQARLLFDKGNYRHCINYLSDNSEAIKSKNDQTEYYYRLGRCYQMQDDDSRAIQNFDLAILQGLQSSRYFAPYAAIYNAKFFLKKKNTELAKQYLSKASKLNNAEYKYSIQQEIKKIEQIISKQ
jgi:hypothetical protein